MHPAGRQADQHIARSNPLRQLGATFHRAHGKACQIKVILGIHSRHLGCFPADQSAARQAAALSNPLYDLGRLRHMQLAGREIIEEKQRLSALADQIIYAHGHKINTHR